MATEPDAPIKYQTPLRQAQRDLTRSRIKDAARNLFYEHHFESTTMDDIAKAAGLRRSTLYLHYKDKAEILGEVISDYTPKARTALAKLPGPKPSRDQLTRWMNSVAKVVEVERVPLSIIMELRRNPAHKAVLDTLVVELMAGLGEKNPPFKEAASLDADPILRARALLLLQQLTYACELYLDMGGDKFGKAVVEVTVGDFHRFLCENGDNGEGN